MNIWWLIETFSHRHHVNHRVIITHHQETFWWYKDDLQRYRFIKAGLQTSKLYAITKWWATQKIIWHIHLVFALAGNQNPHLFIMVSPHHCLYSSHTLYLSIVNEFVRLGKTSHKKNRLPKLPLPPPLPPIRASCTTFFGRLKRRLARISEPRNDDYDNDVSDDCDNNFGTFDDFGVKND